MTGNKTSTQQSQTQALQTGVRSQPSGDLDSNSPETNLSKCPHRHMWKTLTTAGVHADVCVRVCEKMCMGQTEQGERAEKRNLGQPKSEPNLKSRWKCVQPVRSRSDGSGE